MEPRQSPGIIVSFAILSALVAVLGLVALRPSSEIPSTDSYIPFEFKIMSDLGSDDFKSTLRGMPRADHVSAFYQNPDTRPQTVAFFEILTGDYAIAAAILDESLKRYVSPALAFALAYEESGFQTRAFNRNSDSVDRGVFQLNSLSFPSLSVEQFYDVPTNVSLGVGHLAFCLEKGGNDVAALAIYNAGLGRVSKGGTPKRTLDYINRITDNRDRLEALFEAQVVARHSSSSTLAKLEPSVRSTAK